MRARDRTSFNCWENCRKREIDTLEPQLVNQDPEKPFYSITIPIKTVSEANIKEHWTKRNKRHSMQKLAVTSFLRAQSPNLQPPLTITLIRIAPRELDSDNLVSSFKSIRDSIADYIHPGKAAGRADDDKKLKWLYDQEKGRPKEYAVRLEFLK